MNVEIVTPDQTLYKGIAILVQLPGIDGSFEIMKNHAPLISALGKGKIKIIKENNQADFHHINGGVVEVLKNKVLILAE